MNTAERLERLMGTLGKMRDMATEDKREHEAGNFQQAYHDARQILAELPENEKQSGNPWDRFLEARSDVIADFVKDERTWEGIAHEVSADEQQVRRIHENHVKAEKLEDDTKASLVAMAELEPERECPLCGKKTRSTFFANCSCGFRWSELHKYGPLSRDEAIDCAASNLAKVDVTRKILTVFEAFPAGLKELTAEEILAQVRKIVDFEA